MMRLKKFVSHRIPFCRIGILALLITSIYSCKKDATHQPSSITKMVGAIEFVNLDTAITLTWRKALTGWEGENKPAVRYEVNVSLDPTYEDQSKEVLTLETDSSFVHFNEEQLVPLQVYFARVRSIAGSNEARSAWMESAEFFILDEVPEISILRTVKNHEVTDKSAILRWGTDGEHEVTHLIWKEAGELEGQEVSLAGNTSRTITLEELTSNQAYELQLFAGERSMGTASFRTKRGINDLSMVVDLRASSGDPAALRNTLNTIPNGSTVVLARGSVYTFPDLFALNRSVTIISEPGFSAPARLEFASSLDIEEGSDIDSIVFNDLEMIGDVSSTYVLNVGNGGNIGKLVLENCLISDHRGAVRVKSSNTVLIDEITINNSIVQNIGNYGVINVDNTAATASHLRLTNSTVNNAELVLRSRTNGQSITIENVTFYGAPRGGYIFDYNNVSIGGGVTIQNSLFGATSGARSFRASGTPLRGISNTFATNDYDGDLISGVSSYSKSSAQVFAAPDNGDFTVKDEELYTVGDPRWRY
ncbi:fibronectin type III domain-containing protein [Parapedobacter tibetensis]|uniref:fibronectin type III domain-containing protein n=1 Tax=Parapedobacter tibetensis TaxID=2972951 RepID=UPI00214D8A37|nr:fibronectin type III domain-containing protein [Parapedobacter tibetensis]